MKRGRLLWGFGGGQTEKAPPFREGTAEPGRIFDLERRAGHSMRRSLREASFIIMVRTRERTVPARKNTRVPMWFP